MSDGHDTSGTTRAPRNPEGVTMTATTATAWTITDMHAEVAHSFLNGDRPGLKAHVEFPSGSSYDLSRLVGETDWTVDASWGKGSFPHWCNGYGARYLMTKVIADQALIAALNARAGEIA